MKGFLRCIMSESPNQSREMVNPNPKAPRNISMSSILNSGTGRFLSKGEDRDYTNLSHVEVGLPNHASFAIYDGHYGSKGAQMCSRHLHRAIMVKFVKMQEDTHKIIEKIEKHFDEGEGEGLELVQEVLGFLLSEAWKDAMLTESIRSACMLLDFNMRSLDKSGTTAVSLFVRRHEEGAGARVIVSNVGDSRCLMFSKKVGK